MKKVLVIVLTAAVFAAVPAFAQQFKVTDQVKLGGDGGWDYLTYDKDGQRLFITRGSHVMVVDAKSLKVAADIPDLSGIHGVALAPEFNRGFVSNGGDNTVTVFDLKTPSMCSPLMRAAKIPLSSTPQPARSSEPSR
jgi:DNA-binding beta-propeller fold protein YncE